MGYIERDIWKSLPDDLPYKASVRRVLMQAPAADVRPVVRGRWIEKQDFNLDEYYKCSVCGDAFVLIEGTPKQNGYKYCPSCGADMRDGGDAT